jgi:hypothetical protein
MLAWSKELFTVFGAAVRVANAAENHRDPSPADMATLGITRPLPKTW